MPTLPSATQKSDSIIVTGGGQQATQEDIYVTGGKWEDEEERRFYEDIQDLRDFVPKSVLGLAEVDKQATGEKSDINKGKNEEAEKERKKQEENEARELEKELKRLELGDQNKDGIPTTNGLSATEKEEDKYVFLWLSM